MVSKFGWVDFASENREKMMDVVHLFREKDTVDELGIGTIRDAFADYFFPGTSTIQTRARYMLFVPWIYQKIETKEITYPGTAERARRYELKLIHALLKSEEDQGIIGRVAKNELQRLPSEIYWAGLASWGIRLNSRSRSQYHRSLKSECYRKKRNLDIEENPLISYNWDPGLPPAPDNMLEYADLQLRYQDSDYLEDRISCNHGESLLFHLINRRNEMKVNYFWQLPLVSDLPSDLRENIRHARNFSETIHGAFLLYNYLLARKLKDEELITRYDKMLGEWQDKIKDRWHILSCWQQHLDDFWNSKSFYTANVGPSTRSFVSQWLELIFLGRELDNLQTSESALQLIASREKQKKGSRARLHNLQALEMWGGSSGTAQLDFRWGVVETICEDIITGLQREGK